MFRHEIIPSQCRHKVTPSLIEIILQKKNAFRWGALEAPVNKGELGVSSLLGGLSYDEILVKATHNDQVHITVTDKGCSSFPSC